MVSRAYCFTLNNYTEDEVSSIVGLGNYNYLVFGREVGESGTPHLQGFIYYTNNRSLRVVRRDIPRAHFELKKGTFAQAIDYCKKDGNVSEHGRRPSDPHEKGEDQREKWKSILGKAKEGDEAWLEEHYPDVYFKHLPLFRSHRKFDVGVLDYIDTPHEWWYGDTGTGKSKLLNEMFPDAYPKNVSKWWCSYKGEDVVHIEEWPTGINDIMVHHLKKWVDRYKFLAEYKGGAFVIRPKKVIVTSNFSIEQCFLNPSDCAPIKRRFKSIHFAHL